MRQQRVCAMALKAVAVAVAALCTAEAFVHQAVQLHAPGALRTSIFTAARRAAVPTAVHAAQYETSMKVINVGVIGAGRIGIVHLEALASCPDARPIIISNPTVSKAEAAAAKFNVPEFTGNANDVINDPDRIQLCRRPIQGLYDHFIEIELLGFLRTASRDSSDGEQ